MPKSQACRVLGGYSSQVEATAMVSILELALCLRY